MKQMKVNFDFVHREIMGDHVLVPVGKTSTVFNGLFPLTDTAAFIWDLLPDAPDENYIVTKLLGEYEIDKETAEKDVSAFITKLREFRIID